MVVLVIAGKNYMTNSVVNNYKTTEAAISKIKLINEVTKRTFEAFFNHEYESFDALVGENACQIRVMLLLEFNKRYDLEPSLKDTMRDSLKKIEILQDRLKKINIKDLVSKTNKSFEKFTQENDFQIQIPESLEFLCESFILTQTKSKDKQNVDCTVPEKLLDIENTITKNLAKQIVKNVQKNISEKSVKYLMQIADSHQKLILNPRFIIEDSRQIQALPCFFGMEPIIQRLLKNQFPIVLQFNRREKLDEVSFKDSLMERKLFVSKDGKEFVSISLKKEMSKFPERPVFFIEGFFTQETPNIKKVKQLGLKNVILANASQHPQYFGKKKNCTPFKINPLDEGSLLEAQKRFEDFKTLAIKDGFAEENASIFCISHISCKALKKCLGEDK